MGIANPSFADPGIASGLADQWTLRTFCATERIAAFGPAPHEAWECFDRWFTLQTGFVQGDLVMGLFDALPEGHEDFAEGWDTDSYVTELPIGQIAAAMFGDGTVEGFTAGWDTESYATAWDDVPSVGAPAEDLEWGWRSNATYRWTWDDVAPATCLFDAGSEPRETFEGLWPHTTTL